MKPHGYSLTTDERVAALERRVEVLAALLEALGWTALGLALAVVLVTVHRAGGQVWSNVFNVLHVLLSGAVALVSLRLSRRLLGDWLAQPWHHYSWAACMVLVLGGGLEFAQRYVPGSPSIRDLVIDLAGGFGALSLAFGLGQPRGSALGWAAKGVGSCILAAALFPSGAALWEALQRSRQFPTLAQFGPSDLPAITLNDGAKLSPVAEPLRPGSEWRVELTLPGGGFAGVELSPPAGDWARFKELVLPVHSPEAQPFVLELRVHDAGHSGSYDDRFNRELSVQQGSNEFRIPVSEIARGPRRRTLNLNKVEGVVLFAPGLDATHRVSLGSWRLEGVRGQ